MRPQQSAADYVAIAIAPLLIFLMISSLANFFMLVFYHGAFAVRVSWTITMFTLGAVGIARIAIEQDRAYSYLYAGILALVTFAAMLRFVDSPIFCVILLIGIAYVADVIVRDCTLINDQLDASGQGLVDSGRLFLKRQIRPTNMAADQSDHADGSTPTTHQPGRTLLYFAAAALPMFGVGQFFLREDASTWERAQRLLAFYLFASLSLLVTTSFLGLRRYLRQRRAEMPADVSIAWLVGGLVLIAAVLLVAFLTPVPGRALASLEPPAILRSKGNTEASRYGQGQEGAERSTPEVAPTATSRQPEGKQVDDASAAKDAPPGDVGDGARQDGPTGKQSGGEQPSQSGGDQTSAEDGEPGQQENSASQSRSESESGESESGESESGESESGESESGESESGESESGESESGESESGESGNRESRPIATETVARAIPWIVSFMKLIVFLVLTGIVAAFLWLRWDAIAGWWRRALSSRDESEEESFEEFVVTSTQVPPRAFSSFRNPIGKESDLRRIVVITFQAFEAWTREQGAARGKDETPTEFIGRVGDAVPQASLPAAQVVEAYNRIVYGRGQATERDVSAARQIWQLMQSSR